MPFFKVNHQTRSFILFCKQKIFVTITICFSHNCVEAIDVTHVDASVPRNKSVAYIGHCGSPTQNIMTVCNFQMYFTFVIANWEGRVQDNQIFKYAIRDPKNNSLMAPKSKNSHHYIIFYYQKLLVNLIDCIINKEILLS